MDETGNTSALPPEAIQEPLPAPTQIEPIRDLASFEKALKASVDKFGNAGNFWRGHRSSHHPLVASVFRRSQSQSSESNLILNFSGRAGTRRGTIPRRDEWIDWLLIAQHYGLPTRLLDWSLSALVALFFAVEANDADDASDGCLYALNVGTLNQQMIQTRTTAHVDWITVKQMAGQAFGVNPTAELPDAVALNLLESDQRMMLQRAAFTLHSNNHDMNSMPGSEKYLAKFIIPQDAKPQLRWILLTAGMSRSSLFPDLSTLAEELRR
jgi:hypothetical protein